MHFNEIGQISATTTIVDVDRLAEEIRRLKSRPAGQSGKSPADDGKDAAATVAAAADLSRPPAEPNHRPSWGGRFPPLPPEDDGADKASLYKCGR